MELFDLHCDTITKCSYENKQLFKNDLHISLQKVRYLHKYAQVFAIWMPDNHRGEAAIDYFDDIYIQYKKEMKSNSDIIKECLTGEDIQNALANGFYASILSVEGGSAIAGDIQRVNYLYECGVRLITLTWNGENEIAYGAYSEKDQGLTPFGRQVVSEMEKCRMIVDVSHLNEKSFYDVAMMAGRPFVASHSNCDKIYPHIRNLTNDQIKIIINSGGLIGMNFYFDFVGGDNLDDLYRHIYHLLSMGCENTIALGSDFDGCTTIKDLNGIQFMPNLHEYLLGRGIGESVIESIFFKNCYNFFVNNI